MKLFQTYSDEAVEILKNGGMGVIPTDTIYGIVATALNSEAVSAVYSLKGRNENKPFIILISDFKDLETFGVKVSAEQKTFLEENWPGPVSIIFPVEKEGMEYLHRGSNSLAFRLPNKPELRDFINKTGPLVAPSANLEGFPPATDIDEASNYFGDGIGFYCDGGKIIGSPSRLVKMGEDGKIDILRK